MAEQVGSDYLSIVEEPKAVLGADYLSATAEQVGDVREKVGMAATGLQLAGSALPGGWSIPVTAVTEPIIQASKGANLGEIAKQTGLVTGIDIGMTLATGGLPGAKPALRMAGSKILKTGGKVLGREIAEQTIKQILKESAGDILTKELLDKTVNIVKKPGGVYKQLAKGTNPDISGAALDVVYNDAKILGRHSGSTLDIAKDIGEGLKEYKKVLGNEFESGIKQLNIPQGTRVGRINLTETLNKYSLNNPNQKEAFKKAINSIAEKTGSSVDDVTVDAIFSGKNLTVDEAREINSLLSTLKDSADNRVMAGKLNKIKEAILNDVDKVFPDIVDESGNIVRKGLKSINEDYATGMAKANEIQNSFLKKQKGIVSYNPNNTSIKRVGQALLEKNTDDVGLLGLVELQKKLPEKDILGKMRDFTVNNQFKEAKNIEKSFLGEAGAQVAKGGSTARTTAYSLTQNPILSAAGYALGSVARAVASPEAIPNMFKIQRVFKSKPAELIKTGLEKSAVRELSQLYTE